MYKASFWFKGKVTPCYYLNLRFRAFFFLYSLSHFLKILRSASIFFFNFFLMSLSFSPFSQVFLSFRCLLFSTILNFHHLFYFSFPSLSKFCLSFFHRISFPFPASFLSPLPPLPFSISSIPSISFPFLSPSLLFPLYLFPTPSSFPLPYTRRTWLAERQITRQEGALLAADWRVSRSLRRRWDLAGVKSGVYRWRGGQGSRLFPWKASPLMAFLADDDSDNDNSDR